jgi:hypothetical protein
MAREKGEYALLWANGMTFAQVFDLMKEDVSLAWFERGDRVQYDGNEGTVVRNLVEVDWDNGARSTVWESDLLPTPDEPVPFTLEYDESEDQSW